MATTRDRIGSNSNYDRASLVKKWKRFYGAAPPKGLSKHTLELAVAYHQQARVDGGLPAQLKRQLHKVAVGGTTNPSLLKPGARLVREWHGNVYIVDVLEGGYLWRETVFTSLSEVARAITGARWSGPRFFGVSK